MQDLGFRKVTWGSQGSTEVGSSCREAMGALKAPMTDSLFDDSGLCSALGMCCQEIPKALSNHSGLAQVSVEGGTTSAWRIWPSPSHIALRSGLTMGGVPVAIVGCPAGVCLGLSSSLQGICLVPWQSEPSEDGETGTSVHHSLSFTCSGTGFELWVLALGRIFGKS